MISVIELEKYVASIGIFGVIVGKLRHGKKPCPIILLKVDKNSKIGFYCTILPIGLTVRLWIESGRGFLFDAEEIT